MQYIYDEQGITFNYFLLTFLAILLIPTTLSLLFTKKKKDEELKKLNCSCGPCKLKQERLTSLRAPSAAKRINKLAVAVVIGWIFFAYLSYRVATIKVVVEVWDPYQVLGISEGLPLEQIKKVYKKLSLKWHPDKAPEDKKAEHEIKFVDVTKAYKVLTDDDIRKNYEEWGHPDGKQAYSLGIALPTWLVEGKNSPFVLGVYGIVFGLLLPFFVGRWWYSSNGYTKDKIRTHTMTLYFKGLREKSSVKQILELLSASFEFRELVEQRPSDAAALSKLVSSIKEEMEKRFGERFEKSKKYNALYCQKANALLHAHLLRINITDEALQKDQFFIVEKALHLINGVQDIALAHSWPTPIIHCMELRQLLVQAMWSGENPLVQLPHINNDVLKAMKSKKRNIRSIAQLQEMNEEDRRSALKSLSDSQYKDCMVAADIYPVLKIARAYFKVTGDDIVTRGSMVTFILRIRLVESKVTKNDTDESTSPSPQENGTSKTAKTKSKKITTPNGCDSSDDDDDDSKFKERQEIQPDIIHAPYFPSEKRLFWYVFIADEKNDRIIFKPIRVTGIGKERTIRVQFQAPPIAGTFSFVVHVKTDSYVGCDAKKDIKLEVKDFDALPPEEPIDDEISEPEEDSIAGQMKLMREQGLAAAVAGGADGKDPDDTDSESD